MASDKVLTLAVIPAGKLAMSGFLFSLPVPFVVIVS